MTEPIITSEPPAKSKKTKKRAMSAAGRKAVSDAAKARWAAKKTTPIAIQAAPIALPPPPPAPVPPSPAILALQEQIVTLVGQRQQARALLNEAHAAYLAAQSKFQAAENELKGIEQEVQYRITLIGQMENRAPVVTDPLYAMPSSILEMAAMSGNITSEPAQPQAPRRPQGQGQFAVGSADDLRSDVRRMM